MLGGYPAAANSSLPPPALAHPSHGRDGGFYSTHFALANTHRKTSQPACWSRVLIGLLPALSPRAPCSSSYHWGPGKHYNMLSRTSAVFFHLGFIPCYIVAFKCPPNLSLFLVASSLHTFPWLYSACRAPRAPIDTGLPAQNFPLSWHCFPYQTIIS